MMTLDEQRTARFWAKVNKSDTCWLWGGPLTRDGYGQFQFQAQYVTFTLRAHRLAYELMVGPIPAGLTIDHLCRVRNCVNPAHLEAVTQGENTRRMPAWAHPQSRKTHCPQGHPYDEENTFLTNRGDRFCRACCRERSRRDKKQRRSQDVLNGVRTIPSWVTHGRSAYNNWRCRCDTCRADKAAKR